MVAAVRDVPRRVLIVDDDPAFRRIIARTLEGLPGVAVAGAVGSIAAARARLQEGGVDAVTLDVVLRDESGLDLLKWLRTAHPSVKTVLLTSGSSREARTTADALMLGAMGFVLKPAGPSAPELLARALGDALRLPVNPRNAAPLGGRIQALGRLGGPLHFAAPRRIIVVGASTGGPPVVVRFLASLPATWRTPIVIVQHMPANNMAFFAELLSTRTGRKVVLSSHGATLSPGEIVLAAGGVHTLVHKSNDSLVLQHVQGPPEHSCMPAVDPLFRSVAATVGASAVGVVISGMGCDGAAGAVALKSGGVPVVVQDEESSVVWGMPGATVAAGGADAIAPAGELASWVMRWTLQG